MPQYKSFRKKNRYKTLKYTHKNKRKNTNKNNYRGGMPVSMSFSSRGSRSSRPPLSEVPVPEVPVPEVPVPEVLVPEVPVPRSILQASATALASAVLDPREKKIQTLLEETRQLILQLDIIRSITMNLGHYRFFYIEAFMSTIRDETDFLIEKLKSPDIIRDSRIRNARHDLSYKLDMTARLVQTKRFQMNYSATIKRQEQEQEQEQDSDRIRE